MVEVEGQLLGARVARLKVNLVNPQVTTVLEPRVGDLDQEVRRFTLT